MTTAWDVAARLTRRLQYAALLADAEAGKFDVILAYRIHASRRPMELKELTKDTRIKAGVDAGEAERTSERLKRAALE